MARIQVLPLAPHRTDNPWNHAPIAIVIDRISENERDAYTQYMLDSLKEDADARLVIATVGTLDVPHGLVLTEDEIRALLQPQPAP